MLGFVYARRAVGTRLTNVVYGRACCTTVEVIFCTVHSVFVRFFKACFIRQAPLRCHVAMRCRYIHDTMSIKRQMSHHTPTHQTLHFKHQTSYSYQSLSSPSNLPISQVSQLSSSSLRCSLCFVGLLCCSVRLPSIVPGAYSFVTFVHPWGRQWVPTS